MPILDQSTPEVIKVQVTETSLQGEASSELKTLIKSRLAERVRDVHLDMGDVKYMDSAAIGTLLLIIQTLKKDNGKVHLVKASPELLSLVKSLLLDQFLVLPNA